MHREQKFNILTEGLANGVSVICRKHNISRTLYYRWLKRYKAKGLEGLDDIEKDFIPTNRTSLETEDAILNLIRIYPNYGPRALKYLLEEVGYVISESAVFNVLTRHHLTTKELRLKYGKKKNQTLLWSIPPLEDLNSGECWIFWMTDYGSFDQIGHLYEYTIYDFRSKIACSRLYPEVSFTNFEALLTAVAMPVAQTLNLKSKYLCFIHDSHILKQTRQLFKSKIGQVIDDNGYHLMVHILTSDLDLAAINDLKGVYTGGCIDFIMPLINAGISFNELKIEFQEYIRNYNISHKLIYDQVLYSPIEYHNKLTNTKLILPLWAYIDRDY